MIEDKGSNVRDDRVRGQLAMSRSIGDSTIKGVSHEIDVYRYKISDFYLLCNGSDGIFDVLD